MYNIVELDSDHRILTVTFKVNLRTTKGMYVFKSLFKHWKSSVKFKLKTETNYNCLHDFRVGIR